MSRNPTYFFSKKKKKEIPLILKKERDFLEIPLRNLNQLSTFKSQALVDILCNDILLETSQIIMKINQVTVFNGIITQSQRDNKIMGCTKL